MNTGWLNHQPRMTEQILLPIEYGYHKMALVRILWIPAGYLQNVVLTKTIWLKWTISIDGICQPCGNAEHRQLRYVPWIIMNLMDATFWMGAGCSWTENKSFKCFQQTDDHSKNISHSDGFIRKMATGTCRFDLFQRSHGTKINSWEGPNLLM
jgi:hypothetical protein